MKDEVWGRLGIGMQVDILRWEEAKVRLDMESNGSIGENILLASSMKFEQLVNRPPKEHFSNCDALPLSSADAP